MFMPRQVLIEEKALEYPLGRRLYRLFGEMDSGPRVRVYSGRISGLPSGPAERFRVSKETLVLKVRSRAQFQTCRPSAHYQLPLASSCPGMCEYCYLHTTQAKAAYVRAYVNVEEILEQARELIGERKPGITAFEGAATSDPVPLEVYTGSLARTIEMMGEEDLGQFRFVTKFSEIDFLEGLAHGESTEVRFSINAPSVISAHEHRTDSLEERIEAAVRASSWGYPVGFMIAPIILQDDYQKTYSSLMEEVAPRVSLIPSPSFELVTHRFTSRARDRIREIFPGSSLPLGDQGRVYKRGQFGYGKMVYRKELMDEAREFFTRLIQETLPGSRIRYFV